MEKCKHKYKKADKEIIYHDEDEVLHVIKVALPKPPPLETIDGYGLAPHEQFFTRPEYPVKLKKLEKRSETFNDVWAELDRARDYYKKEIDFIEREWDRVLHGYWFFLNGKPTYIDGWHYRYLTYWPLDIGLPSYRSRDRKFFIFARFCYTTTTAYYKYRLLDAKTRQVLSYFSKEVDLQRYARKYEANDIEGQRGDFYVNMGRRVCFGLNFPKHRREGATYKANSILFSIVSIFMNGHVGIQSMDGESGKKAFLKAVVKPWRKQPFFLNPEYTNTLDPKSSLEFDMPNKKTNGKSVISILTGLESQYTFANSANRGWYDGDKLQGLNNDECGKTLVENVNERWQVQKLCLAQGSNIHGLSLNTSTVGEMSEKGGAAFNRLCENSHYENRDKLGQTASGLYNLFIPAYDGLEGFIDKFGESIIEDPTEEEAWKWEKPFRDSNGKLVGAKRYLEDKLDEKLTRNDPESMKEYEEEIRLHPTSYKDCFLTAGSGSGLNIKKISQREKEIKFDKSLTRRGDFAWERNIKDGRVIWIDNPTDGKFIVSLLLPDGQTNQRVTETIPDPIKVGETKNVYRPMYPWRYTSSADPFKFRKTETLRMSNGSGAVFMNRDRGIDPDDKPVHEWSTYKFVCTYSNRVADPDDYAEDMLMMSVYYGAMMFPEINIDLIWKHFELRGYDGYLKYEYDQTTGQFKKTPGYNLLGASTQRLMQAHQQYIEKFISLQNHIEILAEQKKLKGPEDITNRDLFAAAGGCLMGAEFEYKDFFSDDDGQTNDLSNYF